MANPHKIFVNLPVQELARSMDFFRALGFTFNKQFTDEKAACLVLGDDIFVMLLLRPFFKGFITNEVAESKVAEAIISLSAGSREAVDDLVDKAMKSGASPSKEPSDMGFMYSRSFLDPDGHHWEVLFMDPGYVQAN
jgi:predicted lactoylglutathione lyase